MPPFGGMGPFNSGATNVQQPISFIPTTDSMATVGRSETVSLTSGAVTAETTLPLALTVQETARALQFDPCTVGPAEIEDFKAKKLAAGQSKKSINNHLAACSGSC